VGNAVCGQSNLGRRDVYCLSLKTGKPFWSRTVCPHAGFGGNQIEANNGVLLVAGGEVPMHGITEETGVPNDRVFGLNASTGEELWHFKVSCGLWVFLGLFPDDDTTVFQDECGGMYRIGLFNGSQIWHTPAAFSFTDGSGMLGPDGSAYSCSTLPGDPFDPLLGGVLRKLSLHDGAVLWSAETPYPCTNIPSVTADGSTVVVAPGAIPGVLQEPFYAQRAEILSLPRKRRVAVQGFYNSMRRNNTLRAFLHMPDLTGAIMGFDAHTGEVRWQHEVQASGDVQAAGDSERTWKVFIEDERDFHVDGIAQKLAEGDYIQPYCGPVHWSPPSLDVQGRVYIGDSAAGEFRVYDPKADKELAFHTGDGFMPSGAAWAPGLMVFSTCQTVYAFKAEGA